MPTDDNQRSRYRIARLIAVVAGIAGALLCGVVPLLPVKQTTATILWPQGTTDGHVTDITAPLVAGAPQALDVSIPCSAIATLPTDGGLVFSTVPLGGVDATKSGLFVRANKDTVVVAFRDSVATVAKREAVAASACSVLHIWANVGGVGADFVGIPGATGTLPVEKKPQVGGVFTEMKVGAQPGLSARIDIDTRFITAPTTLKRAAMALGCCACWPRSARWRCWTAGRDDGCRATGVGSGRSGPRPGWPTSVSSGPCCSGTSSAPPPRTTATT
ncbi:putative arabinosyltransferase A [Mycobacterium talmoniae]|uniref:Putative arabinosyltransferase A n=1 Tax=Mycobacterium talmoniae TaxID=1858794 RepID=A0A2S8BSH3_9MYCO|nr:putative arabinosyltransferase A [Mycobacterium talmoniae]